MFFSAPVFAQELNERVWNTTEIPQCHGPGPEWKETCDDFSQGVLFHQQHHLEHSRYSYYKACMSNSNTLPNSCNNLGVLEREEQNLKDSDYYLEKACLAGSQTGCNNFVLNQAYQGNFKEILVRAEAFCLKQSEEKLCAYLPFMRDPSKHPIAKSFIQSAYSQEFKRKNANKQIPSD